jgi:hypothetical protein
MWILRPKNNASIVKKTIDSCAITRELRVDPLKLFKLAICGY